MNGKITRTQQILDEADKLLKTDWSDQDKEVVTRMTNSLKSYKSFIPNSFKDDIKLMLEMANRIKKDYDDLLIKFSGYEDKNNQQKEVLCNIEKELYKLDELELNN